MNMNILRSALALGLLLSVGCMQLQTQEPKELPPPVSLLDLQSRYLDDDYKYFVASKDYPKSMLCYRNEELIKQAKGNCTIYICLDQQRGRLYVHGKIAADWPVSTGVSGHETPTGNFKIWEKKVDHASNLYGHVYDAEGKRIGSNAKDGIPEGGRFDGTAMPYWQRLTGDGVGMHIGNVKAGRRLSHGCIRTPRAMAKTLYDVTLLGKTRVYIVQGAETPYYVKDILAMKVGLPEMTEEEKEKAAKAKAKAEKEKAKAEAQGKKKS